MIPALIFSFLLWSGTIAPRQPTTRGHVSATAAVCA